VIEVLGQDAFDEFTALTALHGDGWGMAWLDPDSPTTRSVTCRPSTTRRTRSLPGNASAGPASCISGGRHQASR
jgi:hypothetical protein